MKVTASSQIREKFRLIPARFGKKYKPLNQIFQEKTAISHAKLIKKFLEMIAGTTEMIKKTLKMIVGTLHGMKKTLKTVSGTTEMMKKHRA